MKNLLFALFMFCATVTTTAQTTINWLSIEEAEQMVVETPKPIMMDIYTEWCGPCKMLSKSFEDEKVAAFINANFYAVKFNGELSEPVVFNGKTYDNPDFDEAKGYKRRNAKNGLTKALKLKGYPTIFIFQPDDKDNPQELLGYKAPADLLVALKSIK